MLDLGCDLLDEQRYLERIKVHHASDESSMPDASRGCLLLDKFDEIDEARSSVEFEGQEITGELDRIRASSESGYGDLRSYIRLADGNIGTMRCMFRQMMDAQELSLELHETGAVVRALTFVQPPASFVVVTDLFNFELETACTLMTGFPNFDTAMAYARLRAYDKAATLSLQSNSREALRRQWFAFGESCTAGQVSADYRLHRCSLTLDSLFLEAPVVHSPVSWYDYGGAFDLTYTQL